MKKYIVGLIIGLILAFSINTFASSSLKNAFINDLIKIQVDGQTINTPVLTVETLDKPTGTTYIPARAVIEAMGGKVEWNDQSKTVIINTSTAPYGWVSLTELAAKYKVKVSIDTDITLEKGDKKITFPTAQLPKSKFATGIIYLNKNSLSIKYMNGTTYLNISDLKSVGLIDWNS